MHYHAYEMAHIMMAPVRMMNRLFRFSLDAPLNPFSMTLPVRAMSAACGVFESLTRRYGKPDFAIDEIDCDGVPVAVTERTVARRTFCNLLHFVRDQDAARAGGDPTVLLVAPLSGHYATLLRGTVTKPAAGSRCLHYRLIDARDVPLHEGEFGLDDFIDYIRDFLKLIGPDTHVIAVCQPSVPALAATALMAEDDDPCQPLSLTLMGGPIDTRINPTVVNRLAEERSLSWFESNIIARVPFPNAGFMRKVYPVFCSSPAS